MVTDHKFTGQKLDGTGLQYFNARYYDPAIGVFISPDAIIPDPTNVFGYNRYMYVAGNPLRLTDSSGHFWDTVADVVSIGYDIYEISQNGLTWETGGALAADVAGAAVPFMPAPGACLRWCDDVAQYSDEALEYGSDAAKWVGDKADEAWDGAKRWWNGNPCNSFSADTLVMTAGGLKPIAELVEGDLVLAYNEVTGKVEVHPITATHEQLDPTIVLLTIDGEPIETTPNHPFYEVAAVPGLPIGQYHTRWTNAIDLHVGDLIRQADGTTGVVQTVEIVAREQPMYNLTVAEAHTFFVGDGQWLVHNAGPCGVSLQSKAGVIADANRKGYHVNITNLKKGGVELSLQPGANNSILISTVGSGSAKVDAGGYVGDVNTLLSQNTNSVLDQLSGIVSTLGPNHHRSQEAQKLIEIITTGSYTVAAK